MIKKLFLGAAGIAMAVATVPMFAAFEAHVINVTARIENALAVNTEPISYGTVFPQEQLDRFVDIGLSQSFIDETRVDDIEYVIRQKPKCGLPIPNTDPLAPVEYSEFAQVIGETNEGIFLCPEGYRILPLLCPYLSKHKVDCDGGTSTDGVCVGGNDEQINAFHGGPVTNIWTLQTTLANEIDAHLAKSENDISDRWKIDLKVPCFAGHCAQDWEDYVKGINSAATPSEYIQPLANEHQTFGCDLWFEVTGVSLPGLGCNAKIDLMLVMDRSGSINSTELSTMKDAAHAFVAALAPSASGNHIGQSSFSTSGSLDLHLTSDTTAINAAIDALVSTNLTNLKEGIDFATGELASHAHERDDVPDVMVIITDGNPNVPGQTIQEAKDFGKAAADAAKVAGAEIFVVGIGSDLDAAYLQSIASGLDHYFAAADFDDLEAELEDIAQCNE